ncbi:hypothetical protein V8D89_002355 [Ganoderma adspersum]
MVVPTRLLALSLFTSLAVATPVSSSLYSRDLLVHESRDLLPTGFSLVGPAASQTPLKLRIALSQSNPDSIVAALLNVSDPSSDKYGQHLSKSEVEALVAPSSQSVSAVKAWLQGHGLTATSVSPAGDWLQIDTDVSKANSLLAADFSTFTHAGSGIETVRTLSYSIPAALKDHIDLIHPTTAFPEAIKTTGLTKRAIHEPILPRAADSQCANGTTPACLQKLYNIPTTPATNSSNTIAVTGRIGNYAHYNWLQSFLQNYRTDMDSATNFTVTSVDGGQNSQTGPSVSEGELDIQYTVGIATNVPVDYVVIGRNWTDDGLNGYLDEINYLLSLEHPPQVLSTSYGYAETSMSYALTDKLCKAYAQLGARGVSILFASGDSGVGCQNSNATLFEPTFPSNCPWVTSVGGTIGDAPEVAWDGSSGGFSNYYPAPSYQASAVDDFLTAHAASANFNATEGKYNPVGRGFPDIAAKADNYRIWEGSVASIWGTSASTPVFASIVALINDRLSVQGRPPMGFLNPWLYSTGKGAFTDITAGNNSIECNGETAGFEAIEGWDPVTGLGTPDFNKLLTAVGL